MSGVVKRTQFIFETEILRSGAGLEDVMSCVLDASLCTTQFSGVRGRFIVPQGTVLTWVGTPFASKVSPAFMNNGQGSSNPLNGSGTSAAFVQADVAGILSRTIELIVGDAQLAGTAPEDESDQDASVFHH